MTNSLTTPQAIPKTSSPRPALLGIRHVALFAGDLAVAERFWVDVMGYAVEWRPDDDNVYLCSGSDNLALHRKPSADGFPAATQRLDHIGLAVATSELVDAWAAHLTANGIPVVAAPRTHRDGSRSLYFHAPDGSDASSRGPLVQIIYHRPLSE